MIHRPLPLLLALSLAACKGGKDDVPIDTGPYDRDGDGLYAFEDCDDGNPNVGVPPIWYADTDSDSFGDPNNSLESCGQPSGYVDNTDDCDDTSRYASPIAREDCDGLDNDCDGTVDEDDASDAPTWYPDRDQDGYGDPEGGVVSCLAPSGYGADPSDCNDADADVHPGVCEVCGDGVDNDCDGLEVCDPVGEIASGWIGQSVGDAVGAVVKAAGDVNGDGLGDVLIGAGEAVDEDALSVGRAYIVFGPASGAGTVSSADVNVRGQSAGDGLGTALSPVGDQDGDGYDDVLIGAPGYGLGAGAAFLWTGPLTGSLTLDSATATLMGEAEGEAAGLSVSRAGDVNGDGLADLLLAAPNSSQGAAEAGAIYLVFGPVTGDLSLAEASARVLGTTAGNAAGEQVTGAGDMDGDGFDDVLFGTDGPRSTNKQTGAIYVAYGPVSGDSELGDFDVKWFGHATGDLASHPSEIGDHTGDGRADVAILAAGADGDSATGSGVIYLWNGARYTTLDDISRSDAVIEAPADDAALALPDGGAAWGFGDLDADGFDDLWLGVPGDDTAGTDAGAAYILWGPITGTASFCDSDVQSFGAAPGDAAGRSATGAGDVDGDGDRDLLISAPGFDGEEPDVGGAWLIRNTGW